MRFNTVTIIGATGTMGSNIAGLFASLGNAKVYCLGREIEQVKSSIPKIVQSVNDCTIKERLFPVDYSSFEKCISESDLIFESASEDLNIKMDIANMVSKYMKPYSVSCTGSSGLSITKLAECYPVHLRSRFFGIHMFNPPSIMTLCELISTDYVDKNTEIQLKEYLSKNLARTVVVVKDYPAFLANRIGFQFINEVLQYAEKFKEKGGIDYMDAILGTFTGRSMAPLMTADYVGLDIHKAIVENLYKNTNDYAKNTFEFPAFANRLVSENRLGRKTRVGLYKTERINDSTKHYLVYDIETNQYRDKINYDFSFAKTMKQHIEDKEYKKAFESLVENQTAEAKICLKFLLKYILYALYISKEVGFHIYDADDVMANGFKWCPPIAMYEAISLATDVKLLIKGMVTADIPFNYETLLDEVTVSKYDYRQFFK